MRRVSESLRKGVSLRGIIQEKSLEGVRKCEIRGKVGKSECEIQIGCEGIREGGSLEGSETWRDFGTTRVNKSVSEK